MPHIENTTIAILGVVAIAIVSIFVPLTAAVKEVILVVEGGLIGYIARGKET